MSVAAGAQHACTNRTALTRWLASTREAYPGCSGLVSSSKFPSTNGCRMTCWLGLESQLSRSRPPVRESCWHLSMARLNVSSFLHALTRLHAESRWLDQTAKT